MRFLTEVAALARRVVVAPDGIGRLPTTNIDSRPFSRRDLLRRAPIAAAAVAMPAAALAAGHSDVIGEDPRLLALGGRLDAARTEHQAAESAVKEAVALATAMAGPVPAALVAASDDPDRREAERERDLFGNIIWINGAPFLGRFVYSAAALESLIGDEGLTRRTKRGRLMIERLKIAREYSAARTSAGERSGLDDALDRLSDADNEVQQIARAVADIQARTLAGLTLKARAMLAWAETSSGEICSSQLIGKNIADDLIRLQQHLG